MLRIKTRQPRFRLASFAVFLSTLAGTVSAQVKITLQDAVAEALKNNLQIKQAQLSESLSENALKQSKLALFPTLNASSNLNFNFGRNVDPFSYQFVNQEITSSNGSIYTSLPLFQGFQRINQIAQNKYALDADKSNTQKLKNDLSLTVVTTFLQVLNYQDMLQASQEQADLARQLLQTEQKQFDVGNKTIADLSQARAQVANAELNVTNARNQLDIALLNLAQLMERDPKEKFEVVKPVIKDMSGISLKYSADSIYSRASESFPDIQLARYRTLAAAKAVQVARGSLYPNLNFVGSLGTGYSSISERIVSRSLSGTSSVIGVVEGTGQHVLVPDMITVTEKTPFGSQLKNNRNQTVGFSLSIPIFNGSASRLSVRRASINLENTRYEEQSSRNNFNKTIYQAVTDLRAAESRNRSAEIAYESSKDAFNAIKKRYEVGLVSSLDFNQAQSNLNKAQFDMIQARYDLIFRSKVIDFYLGNPLTF